MDKNSNITNFQLPSPPPSSCKPKPRYPEKTTEFEKLVYVAGLFYERDKVREKENPINHIETSLFKKIP